MTLARDMSATIRSIPASRNSPTTVRQKLFNLFVSPSDVFDEVIASPPNLANWRVPTLLVCLANIISFQTGGLPAQSSETIHRLTAAGTISTAQAQALAG